MSTTRRVLLLSAVALTTLAACSDGRPAPTATPVETYAPELLARLASEQARLDSTARRATRDQAVTSDGLLGGVVGTTSALLTGVVNGLTYTVLRCDLLPYAASTKIIGPMGGKITAGGNVLVVPRGALSAPTVITMEAPSGTSAHTRFAPHGLTFAKPAALTMSYSHCAQPNGYKRGLVYVNAAGEIVEAPFTVDVAKADRVVGAIDHFSGYMVAHTRSE